MSELIFDKNYECIIVDKGFGLPIRSDYLSQLRANNQMTSAVLLETLEKYFDRFCKMFGQCVKPKALIAFGSEKKHCAVIITLGEEADVGLSALKKEDDLLQSLAGSVFLDAWLYSMERHVMQVLRELCEQRKVGVARRLEIGNELPLEEQSDICKQISGSQIGVSCNDAHILTPSKSMTLVFELTSDAGCFEAEHDCTSCNSLNCPTRRERMKKAVTILVENMGKKIASETGEQLLSVLKRNGIAITASCGGSGTCGLCKIQIISGESDITMEDRRHLSEDELAAGMRLACTVRVTGNLRIRIPKLRERKIQAVAEEHAQQNEKPAPPYGIAIDIGTTTLAAEIFSLQEGDVFAHMTATNPQRIHGADVLTRIQAAVDGGQQAVLETLIKEALNRLIDELCSTNEITPDEVKGIAIGANVTMVHLLMGYSCESLGKSPFTPVNTDRIEISVKKLLPKTELDCQVMILPAISTFVGGDIVAGILAQNMDRSDELTLFIDAGTNGEMALGNRERLFVASTAAGPAFEGCGICCGVPSVPGAISGCSFVNQSLRIQTIDNRVPIGICGSGLLDLVSILHKNGQIDDTGRLVGAGEEYQVAKRADGKPIVLTQADIRQLQLAKAAIRAGIELLMEKAQVRADDIARVYIAGGFGAGMCPESIAEIGMLPSECAAQMVSVGNTSIKGARLALIDPDAFGRMERVRSISEEIVLAQDPTFNERFVKEMNF
ncbi:MAG: ASKHA domain-containing protein [bacterium]|nr:ASKHA domain-containing protein [bacterium]